MKKFGATISALVLTCTMLLAFGAQTANAAYPPISVPGNVTVVLGANVTLSFTGLEASVLYGLVVHSNPVTLPSQRSDAAGNMTVTFNTAGLSLGAHTLVATSPDGQVATANFTVVAAPIAGGTQINSGSNSGGLPVTGAQIGGLLGLATLLIGVGFFAVRLSHQKDALKA